MTMMMMCFRDMWSNVMWSSSPRPQRPLVDPQNMFGYDDDDGGGDALCQIDLIFFSPHSCFADTSPKDNKHQGDATITKDEAPKSQLATTDINMITAQTI